MMSGGMTIILGGSRLRTAGDRCDPLAWVLLTTLEKKYALDESRLQYPDRDSVPNWHLPFPLLSRYRVGTLIGASVVSHAYRAMFEFMARYKFVASTPATRADQLRHVLFSSTAL